MAQIFYLGENATDSTVSFRIGNAVWEYWLTPLQRYSAVYLARRISEAKALAYAKRHASYAKSVPNQVQSGKAT